jgi:hypothetical protein
MATCAEQHKTMADRVVKAQALKDMKHCTDFLRVCIEGARLRHHDDISLAVKHSRLFFCEYPTTALQRNSDIALVQKHARRRRV